MDNKKRILIIDDEPTFTHLLKLNLERTGEFEVQEENQGTLGLETAKKFKPDLILLDVIMPDIDGGALAAQIKDDKEVKHTPIVFLTAILPKKEVRLNDGFIAGNEFIAKPVSAEEVVSRIKKRFGEN